MNQDIKGRLIQLRREIESIQINFEEYSGKLDESLTEVVDLIYEEAG